MMNLNQPADSESDPNERSTQIERNLQRQQPRPVSFSAETIISAARRAETQPVLSDRTARKQNDRSARWLTISAAFACGAVAGVLLTSLVLIRGQTTDEAVTTNHEEKELQSNVVAIDKNNIRNDIKDERPPVSEKLDSQWSRSDWVVAAQLLEMHGPGLTGEQPLMAGNIVLQFTSSFSIVEDWTVDGMEPSTDLPDSETQASETVRPTRSMERKQLLRELLDGRSSSRL